MKETFNPTTEEKSLKYEDYLQQSQQEIDKQELKYHVRKAQLTLKADILATEEAIDEAKRALIKAKRVTPFNSKNIIKAQTDVEELTVGLFRLKMLEEELF